jgi:hypothetical protein
MLWVGVPSELSWGTSREDVKRYLMEIRDPIHGFIKLENEHEERILALPEFQRLRRIHQLAAAYLLYPGATHTRFEHSLGTFHVATKLAKNANLEDHRQETVRLAALLHDIGHGPFSHVSEYALKDLVVPGNAAETESLHEKITLGILRHILYPRKDLNKQQLQSLESVFDTAKYPMRTVERDIISGKLDADILDYLLRDSQYCGVKYGVYDLDRITQAARVYHDPPYSHLAFAEEDCLAIDQVLFAKHYMDAQVYRHETRWIADAMLRRAIVTAAKRSRKLRALFSFSPDDPEWLQRWLGFDDYALEEEIMSRGTDEARDLVRRLKERRLLYRVLFEPIELCGNTEFQERAVGAQTRVETVRSLEDEAAKECGIKLRHLVFADVIEAPYPETPEGLYLLSEQNHRTDYRQVSHVFSGALAQGERREQRLVVYLPVDEPDRQRRQEKKAEYANKIRELLKREEAPDA